MRGLRDVAPPLVTFAALGAIELGMGAVLGARTTSALFAPSFDAIPVVLGVVLGWCARVVRVLVVPPWLAVAITLSLYAGPRMER